MAETSPTEQPEFAKSSNELGLPAEGLRQIEDLPRLVRGTRLSRADVIASQRARLIAALAHLMARQGYDAVTVVDIVALAGTSKSVFYEHFDTKEACYLAGLDGAMAAVGSVWMRELAADASVEACLRAAIAGYAELLATMPDYASAYVTQAATAGERAVLQRSEQLDQFARALVAWHDLKRTHQPELEPLDLDHAVALIAGIRELLIVATRNDGPTGLPQHSARLGDLAVKLGRGTISPA